MRLVPGRCSLNGFAAAIVLDEAIGWWGAAGIALVGAGLVITATVRLDEHR